MKDCKPADIKIEIRQKISGSWQSIPLASLSAGTWHELFEELADPFTDTVMQIEENGQKFIYASNDDLYDRYANKGKGVVFYFKEADRVELPEKLNSLIASMILVEQVFAGSKLDNVAVL